MNIPELNQIVTKAERAGFRNITMTIPPPKAGLRGRRVKTPFGLCEVLCHNSDNEVVFTIETKRLRKFLDRSGLPKGETLPGFGY